MKKTSCFFAVFSPQKRPRPSPATPNRGGRGGSRRGNCQGTIPSERVFEGAFLREITGRKGPVRPLGEMETFWSVPSGDLPVEMTIKRGDNPLPLETTLAVRFEPEMGLGTLLEGREELTGGEWGDLVRSQFAGLLDLLSAQKEDLIGLSGDSLEQLRAKFSLLLSDGGLRCVEIEPFIERPEPGSSETSPEETVLGDAAEFIDAVTAEKNFFEQSRSDGGRFAPPLIRSMTSGSDGNTEILSELRCTVIRRIVMKPNEPIEPPEDFPYDIAHDRFLSTREAMKFLNLSRSKLWDLVQSGELPAFKIGGDYRYRCSELVAWMERYRVSGQPEPPKNPRPPKEKEG